MVFLQHEQGNNLSKYKIIGIIMETIYDRTLGLIGDEALDKLKRSRILVFGLGGVGGYLTEALARAGVGNLTLVDFDTVSVSNINRQVLALHSTVGMKKTEVMEKRLLDINPSLNVVTLCQKVDARWIDSFNFDAYDYIGDAIDDVPGKIAIIEKAKAKGIPVISCLGTGGRLDPTKFQITLKKDADSNFWISLSLSTINLTATDWTLPALNPILIFFQRTGDNSNPTNLSRTLLAC